MMNRTHSPRNVSQIGNDSFGQSSQLNQSFEIYKPEVQKTLSPEIFHMDDDDFGNGNQFNGQQNNGNRNQFSPSMFSFL